MTTQIETLIGVDLSLTSPAVCVFKGVEFDISSCKFHYLTDKKKYEYTDELISGERFSLYDNNEQRYHNISEWIMAIVKSSGASHVFIEDYSFASTGRVFNIAENAGLLKHKLWRENIPFTTIPPTVIKKYATGKGNATKETLQDAFIKLTNVNVKARLDMTDKQWNPSSDIIDSFYICGCGHEKLRAEPTP